MVDEKIDLDGSYLKILENLLERIAVALETPLLEAKKVKDEQWENLRKSPLIIRQEPQECPYCHSETGRWIMRANSIFGCTNCIGTLMYEYMKERMKKK